VEGQSAAAGLTPQSWTRVAHLLPRDDSGYQFQPRDGDYNGILPDTVLEWAARIAPLGMSPQDFRSFLESLADALAASGVTPNQVDARLQGSSAHFFSGQHKSLPTEAEHPRAVAQFDVWLADDPDRPLRRPFDAMHRLGLENVPSDYDVQLSSDAMIDRVRLIQKLFFPDQKDLYTRYDFVKHALFEMAFPPVYRWSKLEQRRLNREVAPALFKGSGPPDKSPGVSSHFRDTDWRLDLVQTEADAQAQQRLRVVLTLHEVAAAVQALPEAVSSQTLIHELHKRPDLVELLLDSPEQRQSLLVELVAFIAEEGR
jgi:hypothetical protein